MERSPFLHRHDRIRDLPHFGLRLAGVALTGALSFVASDTAFSYMNEPERTATVRIHDPETCHDAELDIVYLDPTGKPVAHHLAELNHHVARRYNGASYSMQYGSRNNIEEFADAINTALQACRTDPEITRPVVLVGQSLGGKKAQEIANSELVPNIVAIIQEATPTGPEDIRDDMARTLVTITDLPLTIGKFPLAISTFFSSYQRGVNPFDPLQQQFNRDSVAETSVKTLGWQRIDNGKPYPETDKPIPLYYIYSSEDGVVYTAHAIRTLQERIAGPVIPMQINPEYADPTNLNHAEGWVDWRHFLYKDLYDTAFWAITFSLIEKPEEP